MLMLALTQGVRADDARILSAEVVRGDGGYVLNADIDIELNSRLADAVMRGVSLYFTTELRIERPRWYWLNEVAVDRSLEYRLSYHAITRSYRLSALIADTLGGDGFSLFLPQIASPLLAGSRGSTDISCAQNR